MATAKKKLIIESIDNYTNWDVVALKKASSLITEAVCYEDTKEGAEFWHGVVAKLNRISDNIKKSIAPTDVKPF